MTPLTLEDWKNLTAIGQSVATVVSLGVGAVWVYRRYIKYAEHRPNVGLVVRLSFLGIHQKSQIVEISCAVENKGKVPYNIHKLSFTLDALNADDPIENDNRRGQVRFGSKIAEGSFLAPDYVSIVDPGVVHEYFYVVAAPERAAFLKAHVSLRAPGSGFELHTAERTAKVPS